MIETRNKVKVHFVGIGGIGMSGIAEVLLSMGYPVSGSDLNNSPTVEKLTSLGAKVFIGHKAENLEDSTIVVFTSAVDDTNPEIAEAKRRNIPLMRRAEMLAELMRLKHGLAVAGTHGKTTTTSFLSTILQESKIDPTYIIGGIVKNLNGHAKVGKGDILVAEADESDGSFLLLNPVMSVITNIDLDHMDFYGSERRLVKAFRDFANKVPFYGCCAFNIHDKFSMKIKKRMKKPSVTFGIADTEKLSADFLAKNISYSASGSKYDLYYKNEFAVSISIGLPGRHNVLNSLGAVALAFHMNVGFEQIAESICKFDGIGRRFQTLYSQNNIEIIDDYAHHPTEILNTLQTVYETRKDSKIMVVFEPHRYSRTQECWDKFFHCFNAGNKLLLLPIYAASESPIPGIDSDRLVSDINKLHPGFAEHIDSIDDLKGVIDNNNGEKMTILALGAGSIGRKIKEFAQSL